MKIDVFGYSFDLEDWHKNSFTFEKQYLRRTEDKKNGIIFIYYFDINFYTSPIFARQIT